MNHTLTRARVIPEGHIDVPFLGYVVRYCSHRKTKTIMKLNKTDVYSNMLNALRCYPGQGSIHPGIRRGIRVYPDLRYITGRYIRSV